MNIENKYSEYCYLLIKYLCAESKPQIRKTVDERGVLLTVSDITNEDMRKVVGKNGSHAKAIRTLLRAAGMAENAKVSLKILEPGESNPDNQNGE